MNRWTCFQASLLFFQLVFYSNAKRDDLFKQAKLKLLKDLNKGEGK